jgi:PhoU domain
MVQMPEQRGRAHSVGRCVRHNLEHVGDIIDKNLSEVAAKKIKRKLQFSPEGAAELTAFHERVLDSLKIAFAVFMSGDVIQARKLIAEKAELRNAELAAAERHLERLREGRPETLETTSLHLDVLRDLKRIHSHICSVAYPVLDMAGETPAPEVAESDSITLASPSTKPTAHRDALGDPVCGACRLSCGRPFPMRAYRLQRKSRGTSCKICHKLIPLIGNPSLRRRGRRWVSR